MLAFTLHTLKLAGIAGIAAMAYAGCCLFAGAYMRAGKGGGP